MGQPGAGNAAPSSAEYIGAGRQARELTHLSTSGKEINRDSPSSGERKGNSLNLACVSGHALHAGGRRARVRIVSDPATVTKSGSSRSRVEPRTTEGNRPVGERALTCRSST